MGYFNVLFCKRVIITNNYKVTITNLKKIEKNIKIVLKFYNKHLLIK